MQHLQSRFIRLLTALFIASAVGCGEGGNGTDPGGNTAQVDAGGNDGQIAQDTGGGIDTVEPDTVKPDTVKPDTEAPEDTGPIAAAVAIGEIKPAKGPITGGSIVELTGAGLQDGVIVAFGGAKATILKAEYPARLVVQTPAGAEGKTDVTVTNPDGGAATRDDAYTYQQTTAQGPSLSKVAPNKGPTTGGTVALVTGANFKPGASFLLNWEPVSKAELVSPTSVQLTTAPLAPGNYDLAVMNPDGQAAILKSAFTAVDPADLGKKPSFGVVYPGAGSVSGGTAVKVSGTNFDKSSTLMLGGEVVTSWVVDSATSGQFKTQPHDAGLAALVLSNPDGQSAVKTDGFLYYVDPPVVYGITPSEGGLSGGNQVIIAGAYFAPQLKVQLGGKDCTGAKVSGDGKSVTCTAPAGDKIGSVGILVENPDGLLGSLPKAYAYIGAPKKPQLTGVNPNSGPLEGGLVAVVSGDHLPTDAKVFVGGTEALPVLAKSGTAFAVTIPKAAKKGKVDVVLKAAGFPDAVLTSGFEYVEAGAPQVTEVVPKQGLTTGGVVVVVKGKDLRPNAEIWFGPNKAQTSYVLGPQGLGVLLPKGKEGAVDVTVKTPGFPDAILKKGFTYKTAGGGTTTGPVLALAQVLPATGPVTGGHWALLKGANLPTDAKVFFGGKAASQVVVIDGSTVSAKVPAGAKAGTVDVSVQDPGSLATATAASAYTYMDSKDLGPAPKLSTIKPAIGPSVGGTMARADGTGLKPGALVFVGGKPATGVVSVPGGKLGSFTTPPNKPGAAPVMWVNPDGQFGALNGSFVYTSGGSSTVSISAAKPTQGTTAGGTQVSLVGKGFGPGSVVFMGGVPVSALLEGPTAMSLVTPPHDPGLVDIAITNASGWTATLSDAFNFVLEAPFVATLAPDWGKPEGGTKVIIAGQGFHPKAVVTFGGKPAKVVSATNTALTVTSPAGTAGKADVTVTNPDFLTHTLKGGFTYTNAEPGKEVSVTALMPDTASKVGGSVHVLQGNGFGAGSSIVIGSTLVKTVKIIDNQTLEFTAPALAVGAHAVKVIVPGVGSFVAENAFFAWDPASKGPKPLIKSVQPGLGPISGGTVALIRVTPADAKAKVFFGGKPATVLGADGTDALVVSTPPNTAGPVNVSVMLADGKAHTQVGAFSYYKPAPGVKPPVLTQLKPSSGANAGGETIAFSGSEFAPGSLAFLGFRPVTGVAVQSSAALTGKTPAHPQGLVSAAITRPDGFSSILKSSYSYKVPAPEPKDAFPTVGHTDGGTTVAISGKYFAVGAKVFFGKTASTEVKVAASGVLTAKVPPVASAGKVDLRVLNPDGQQGTLGQSFTYTADNFDKPAPKVAKLVPDRGPFSGGTVLVVWGNDFQPGAKALIGGKPAKVHVVSSGYLTLTTPAGFIGPADVTVLNPDGQGDTKGAGFTWNSPAKSAPKLLGITPASGPEVGGTPVILTGADFGGAGMGFVGYRPLSSWTVLNSAIATGTTIKGDSGKLDVVITNGDGQSAILSDAFDMVGAPRIDSFNPSIGATAGGTLITIAGKNFSTKAKVTFGGKDAQSVSVLSPFVIKVTTPVMPAGPAQLKVSNPDGQSFVAKDPYLFVLPPQVSSIFPAKGSAAGGTPVIVRGKDFLKGAKVFFGKTAATNITWIAGGILTVRSPKGTAGGAVAIRVDNPDGQSALSKQSFAYLDPSKIAPPPKLTAIKPTKGPTSGGTWGLLTALGLQDGAQMLFGSVPAAQTQVFSGGKSARFVTAPSPVTATVDVILLQPDGGFATMKSAFAYTDPAKLGAKPAIATLEPISGPTKGGTPVVLTGAGLDEKGLVFFDGLPSPLVTKATNGISATTPAHGLGSVTVVHTDSDGWSIHKDKAFAFVPPPTLKGLNPKAGPAAGGTTVTLSGTFFATGDKGSAFGSKTSRVMFCTHFVNKSNCVELPKAQIEVKDAQTIVVKTSKQVSGLSDVAVINPDGQSAVLNQAFLFRPPPKIVGIKPAQGSTLGSETIEVVGSGFQNGASVRFGQVVAKKVTVVSSTKLSVETPPGKAGPIAVTVVNPDLSTHTVGGGFLYIAPPEVTNIFPSIGPETGGTVVTIQGANFVKGAKGSKVYFGSKLLPEKDVQIDSTGIIKAKSPAGTGPVAVKIINPDDQFALKAGGFVYVPKVPAPTVSHMTPNFGSTTGGILVSIYGKGFLTGAQIGFGNDAAGWTNATSVNVLNGGTLIVAKVPAHLPGKVDVKVTNSDGQKGVLSKGFEYLAALGLPALAFKGVVPDRGPNAGGYEVVLYGQGFKSGVKVYFGQAGTATWTEAKPITRLGPTLIRVTVPKAAKNGKVDIRMVNPAVGGKADELVAKTAFTYGQSVVLEPFGHRLPLDKTTGDSGPLIIDANGDGLNDVIVRHSSGRDDLFIQSKDKDGNPGYFIDASAQMPNESGSCRYRHNAVVADIDGDKDMDVVFRGYNRYLCIYRNVSDGTFKVENKGYDSELYQTRGFFIADLTCDGKLDLLVTRDGYNRIFVGDGTGKFKKDTKLLPSHNEPSRGAAFADVDKDGDNDLLIANDNAVQNRLYYNSCNNVPKGQPGSFSDATYGNKKNFPVSGFNSRAVQFADLNGDGWLDAIIWNWGQTDRVYLNSGGNFLNDDGLRFPQNEKLPYSAWGTFTDVDGDGDLDVITQKYTGTSGRYWPAVYLNDKAQGGPGRFTDASPSNMPQWRGEESSGMAVGDLDGDGLPDIYIVKANHQDWLLLNHGFAPGKAILDKNRVAKGSFANNTFWGIPPDVRTTTAAAVGDIDGDGDIDIVMASAGKGALDAWINDGSGNFFSQGEVRFPTVKCNATELQLIDLNKDGDLDIIMSCYYVHSYGGDSGGLRQLVNDGKGYFKDVSKAYMPDNYTSRRTYGFGMGDFDGDGDADMIASGYYYDPLRVLVNGGDPFNLDGAYFFAKDKSLMDWYQSGKSKTSWVITDLNNDKQADVFMGVTSGQNQLFHNTGGGKMQNVTSSHLSAGSDQTDYVIAADVDKDGDIDLFSVNNGTNRLSVGELDYKYADVTASHLPSKMSAYQSTHGVFVDLDLDGMIDIVTSTYQNRNQLLLNTGDAHFGDFTTSLPADKDPSYVVCVADFDKDGRPDLFFGNRDVNRIYLNKTPKPTK
ncbi:MAG: IPT/TIG domain-containing protein [Myxococcales bacterium]|nr:IPT/TIG domain-containing protein [Myxococcales bacterium]